MLLNTIFIQKSDFSSNEDEWLLNSTIPSESIGVLYGASGSGKTTISLYLCKIILEKNNHTRVFYINADMGIANLKKYGFKEMLDLYENRFYVADLTCCNEKYIYLEKIYDEILSMQDTFKVFIVVDSLNSIARKIGKFIDPNYLFAREKIIRKNGGSVLFIHHLNKNGVFADSQQIIDYSDYTIRCVYSEEKESILLIYEKMGRYPLFKNRAFRVKNLRIIEEIEFNEAELSCYELEFIKTTLEILKMGKINQSELIKLVLRNCKRYVGREKARKLLQEYAKKGKWCMLKDRFDNNSIYYYLKNEEK
ncbi:helicase DnaB [Campylobacter lari]|nr:helicase DnaB [Campylobacter lari]